MNLSSKKIRLIKILGINVLVFLLLFVLGEISYRMYRNGITGAFGNDFNVPYSNLGTDDWVIYDEALGFRLNPDRPDVNSLSMKDTGIVTSKPDGLYRVIYLGDSVAYDNPGFVNQTSEVLAERGNIEVKNASTPGYTTYQELTFLKQYLLDISPDLVILTYVLNDNHRFLHRFDGNANMLMTEEAKDSLTTDSFFDKIVSWSYVLTDIKFAIKSPGEPKENLAASQFPWDNRADFNIAWKDGPWEQFEKYLVEMMDLLSQSDTKFSMVVFSFEPQLNEKYLTADRDYVLKPQRKLQTLCDKYDIPCLDLFPAFETHYRGQGPRLFRDGIHLGLHGHELATEKLLEFLSEEQLVPY